MSSGCCWRAAAFIGSVALELRRCSAARLFRLKETVSQFETVTSTRFRSSSWSTFLIGVVFAYLLGVQAQRFGAAIFVVDGVGLAICRELSPILVAVIVAGRSGAAFTAQISSMKVQEEIDAIQTLGLSPIQVLVVPRLVARSCSACRCSCSSAIRRHRRRRPGRRLATRYLARLASSAGCTRFCRSARSSVGLVKAPVFARSSP